MPNKTCQRCNTPFECQSENISSCSCFTIQLSNASKKYLTKTTYDCLCTHCLLAINAIAEKIENEETPSKLEESRDFYMEHGLMVLTEYYHIKKDSCCKNNCRHCPYGFKSK
jgi:hypothetical protein